MLGMQFLHRPDGWQATEKPEAMLGLRSFRTDQMVGGQQKNQSLKETGGTAVLQSPFKLFYDYF